MAEIFFDNICKTFPGGVEAVKDFTLTIHDKEFMVFVGPSGCGKSTTLRMVAGLEEITDGTIRIGDKIVNDVPPKDRDIAMVFQNYALYPHMTVYQNMAFALKLRKYPKQERDKRVHDAAKILGIEELLERRPKALSGGQRQRVAVGRAIVRHPAAFLFDEPLSNLDAKLRVEMRAELKRLHATLETTTIYVTHDQEEAMTLGNRIVVMKDGVIQQCGAPLEVYNSPTNRFVAGFVGTPPMNFFAGSLTGDDGDLWFDEGSFRIRLEKQQADHLGSWTGRDMICGVRPEAMGLVGDGRFAGRDNTITVRVNVIEPFGESMDIYVATPKHPHIVARTEARSDIEPDQNLKLHLDMSRIHIFEPGDMGANLSRKGEPAVV